MSKAFSFTIIFLLSAVFLYRVMEVVGSNYPTASTAMISVDPSTMMAEVGQIFMINITISDVIDLYGWEFKLRWNSTLLEVLTLAEGSFLKGGGNTFFARKINNTVGYMLVDCMLVGDVPGISGYGTLATVKFHVKGPGECVLDLYGTKCVSSFEEPITHTAIDGHFVGARAQHDIAIISVAMSKTITNDTIVYINVTVENQGNANETFNVTVYNDLNAIETQTITNLTIGARVILTYPWNTATVPKGNYTISAIATAVLGETDTADNTLIDGWIKETIRGDLNGDGTVDIRDITIVAMAFGAKPGDPDWVNNGDLDNNSIIDIRDITTVATEFGKSDP